MYKTYVTCSNFLSKSKYWNGVFISSVDNRYLEDVLQNTNTLNPSISKKNKTRRTKSCLYVMKEMVRPPCWLPRGQQVSHQSRISGIHCTQAMKQASKGLPWLGNPGQTSPEVQNRGVSGPIKRTDVFRKKMHCQFRDRILKYIRYSDELYFRKPR